MYAIYISSIYKHGCVVYILLRSFFKINIKNLLEKKSFYFLIFYKAIL